MSLSSRVDSAADASAPLGKEAGGALPPAVSHDKAFDASPELVTPTELADLCMADSMLYCSHFFPRTVRQDFAPFHPVLWRILESGQHRLVNVQMFRDGGKTTTLRLFASKRIAYGISHTILCISKSEAHARRTVRWIKRQVELNHRWTSFYGLRKGGKWSEDELEIIHEKLGFAIYITGMGITGSTRGINFDDFRPDLIIVDDIIDEENAATPEQRQKIERLFYGAIVQSLTPVSESPDAMIVMLQTPLNREDVSAMALRSSRWKNIVIPKLNRDEESNWPARYPTAEVLADKAQAIKDNRLSIWLAENMCQLVSPETNAFKPEWLTPFDVRPPRSETVIVIDPVPPPSEREIAKGLVGKDFEAFAVVQRWRGGFYILEVSKKRGHEPDWTVTEFFRLARKYKPRAVLVESIAYQRVLAWLLRQAMQTRREYYVVEEFVDKRRKHQRILDALSGPGANGKLFYDPLLASDLVEQFVEYPSISHDDVIDAVSVGVARLHSGLGYDTGDGWSTSLDDDIELLDKLDADPWKEGWRAAV